MVSKNFFQNTKTCEFLFSNHVYLVCSYVDGGVITVGPLLPKRTTKIQENRRERTDIKLILQVPTVKNLQNSFSEIWFFCKKVQITFSESFNWCLDYKRILSLKKKSEEICNFTLKSDVNKPMSIKRNVNYKVVHLFELIKDDPHYSEKVSKNRK